MRFRNFLTVLKKEFIDLFRDKKTIFASLVLPILIYPVIMFFLSGSSIFYTDFSENPKIAVINAEGGYVSNEDADYKFIKKMLGTSLSITYLAPEKNYDSAIVDRDIYAVIKINQTDLETKFNNNDTLHIEIIFDDLQATSVSTCNRIVGLINDYLQQKDKIAIQTAPKPVGDTLIDGTVRKGINSSLLIDLIPMIVTILISVGGVSVVVDLVAGEKERNTFEPLLSTGASRFSILSAKYVVMIAFAILSALSQLLSMVLGVVIGMAVDSSSFASMGAFNIGIVPIIVAFINIVLLASIFCSLMLVLTSTAKTYREASTKASMLMFVPIIFVYAIMFQEAMSINLLNMIAPIVNVSSVIKMVLSGITNWFYFAVAIVSNIIYVGIAIGITLWTFNRESLITRG